MSKPKYNHSTNNKKLLANKLQLHVEPKHMSVIQKETDAAALFWQVATPFTHQKKCGEETPSKWNTPQVQSSSLGENTCRLQPTLARPLI